jgi:hypothetical protein
MGGAQVFEKNRFLTPQNRASVPDMSPVMSETERNRTRLVMLMIAAALAVATIAPVAVLAA